MRKFIQFFLSRIRGAFFLLPKYPRKCVFVFIFLFVIYLCKELINLKKMPVACVNVRCAKSPTLFAKRTNAVRLLLR